MINIPGQISLFDIFCQTDNPAIDICPYDEQKHCSNAEDCKEFKELYG